MSVLSLLRRPSAMCVGQVSSDRKAIEIQPEDGAPVVAGEPSVSALLYIYYNLRIFTIFHLTCFAGATVINLL